MSLRRPACRSPETSFGGIAAAETVPSDDGTRPGVCRASRAVIVSADVATSERLALDGGDQRHSLTYFCCPASRVLRLPRMYFQGRIRLFGAEGSAGETEELRHVRHSEPGRGRDRQPGGGDGGAGAQLASELPGPRRTSASDSRRPIWPSTRRAWRTLPGLCGLTCRTTSPLCPASPTRRDVTRFSRASGTGAGSGTRGGRRPWARTVSCAASCCPAPVWSGLASPPHRVARRRLAGASGGARRRILRGARCGSGSSTSGWRRTRTWRAPTWPIPTGSTCSPRTEDAR
jgi:hypothetical protein